MKSQKEYPVYPPRAIVSLTNSFRFFLLRLFRRFTHPKVAMWEMVHNFWLAAGIGVAAELGLADLLKNGPRSVAELAASTQTNEASLYRLLRMLSSQGIFREEKGRTFMTTSLSRSLEEDEIRYLIMMHLNPHHFAMFGDLLSVIKETEPLSRRGRELFAQFASQEERNDRFNRAMSNASLMQVPALLPAFPFCRYRKIVDVGGGQGRFLAAILKKCPGSKGVIFDLEAALFQTREFICQQGLDGRMETVAGDFFKAVPEGGDLYMMKSVLHDWNDEDALKILKRVHQGMPAHARLLIIESVLGAGNKPSFGKMTDILMLVSAGGKERTRAEFDALLSDAGFRIRKIHRTISPHSIIESEKK